MTMMTPLLHLLLLMLTMEFGMAEAGKLVYTAIQTDSDVVCPGEEMRCPSQTTCCQLTSGRWGCCEHPEATCCSDNRHCCPHGSKCDVEGARCVNVLANKTTSWAKKIPAVGRKAKDASPKNVVCPDGSFCPVSTAKCCKSLIGYSCCIYPFDVCCSGSQGCCLPEYGLRFSHPSSFNAYPAEVEWSLIAQDDD